MRKHYDVLEEKRIGKVKDSDIFKKLIYFSKPYSRIFVLTVLLLFGITFFQLGMPYLMKSAIDRAIMPTTRKLIKTDNFISELREKYNKAFHGNYILLHHLPLSLKKDL